MYCNEVTSYCLCIRTADHDGPHRCQCGGEWHYNFAVDAWPNGADPTEYQTWYELPECKRRICGRVLLHVSGQVPAVDSIHRDR